MMIVILLAAVSRGAVADNPPVGRTVENIWSENINGVFIAGSGDNPWALPRPHREKPKGPSYQVNPHYVTPEDIEADSLPEGDRKQRKRGSSETAGSSGNNDSSRQPDLPYGLNYMPGYPMPGYGGYYGGLPGVDGNILPGFGGNPMLYPYGGGMGLEDPYNLMVQPYSSGSGDDSE